MMNRRGMAAAMLTSLGLAASASASAQLQMDLNSLLTTGASGFGTGFTGTINIGKDGDAVLNDILIDGLTATGFLNGSLVSMNANISFVGGVVTGGNFDIVAYEDGTQTTTSTYSATIRNNSGDINDQAGQGFSIDGLTYNGTFSTAMFAGVDVTEWNINEPLSGSFIEFALNPDANGMDEDSNIDLFVAVPLPTAAGMGLIGVGGLAFRRRRA